MRAPYGAPRAFDLIDCAKDVTLLLLVCSVKAADGECELSGSE